VNPAHPLGATLVAKKIRRWTYDGRLERRDNGGAAKGTMLRTAPWKMLTTEEDEMVGTLQRGIPADHPS